jgi:protein-disulfide isomerase
MNIRGTILALAALTFAASASAQSPATPAPTPAAQATQAPTTPPTAEQAHVISLVETFLRNLFAWGPDFDLKLGPLKDATIPNFYEVPIQVTFQGQSEGGNVYASKDGKYVVRGELYSTNDDPFAKARKELAVGNAPSKGPADAKVTLVEFSDFECPHCRALRDSLKQLEPQIPQVRIVFRNFPIEHIHPWAMTAALGARCAFQTSNDAFWKFHDSVFDQQDVITADNAYDKLTELAVSAGLDKDAFHTCLADPATKKAVDDDEALGTKLAISSTPTVFINGRESVGGDPASLQQLITYELQPHK